MAIITLITDFGLADEYVGVMKGVILGIDPAARIVDVTHAIEPRDTAQAAFTLAAAYPQFPPGSIHVVVVDPGVGTERRLLCLESDGHFFLGPDNGVLTPPLRRAPESGLRLLQNPALRRPEVSPTFHGRDILAPAAAHLSRGVPAERLGPAVDREAALRLAGMEAETAPDGAVIGRIVHIDRFGNLITNIHRDLLAASGVEIPGTAARIEVGGRRLRGVSETYARVEAGRPLTLIGSRGLLEIAVNSGSARDFFRSRRGDPVRVSP
jgi:hypothetical protein